MLPNYYLIRLFFNSVFLILYFFLQYRQPISEHLQLSLNEAPIHGAW
jgi:hypothetical protein